MADVYWVGEDGDWNDPENWSSGLVPTSSDVAVFQKPEGATVEGSAFIGALLIQNQSLAISGDFQGDGSDIASINDQLGSNGTLNVLSWTSLTLDQLDLSATYLEEQGALVTGASTVASGTVSGDNASWLSSQTTVTGTLSIVDGANVFGTLNLTNGAEIDVDNISNVAGGTITASANSSVDFSSAGGFASDGMIEDAIYVLAGATLTLQSEDGSPIIITGGVSGPGSVYFSNTTLVIDSDPSTSATPPLAQSQAGTFASKYVISDSTLNLQNESAAQSSSAIVEAEGASDTVLGGSSTCLVNVLASSSAVVDLGSGAATVNGSAGTLSVSGGAGDLTVYDAHSPDVLVGGSSNNTLVGGNGSSVSVAGDGLNVIGTTGSSGSLNASGTTGNTSLFSSAGIGTTTMIAGSGNDVLVCPSTAAEIQCGSGSDSVWAGDALSTTIQGGDGNDVIQSGKDAEVAVTGSGADTVVCGAGTTSIAASSMSGSLTIFSVGSERVDLSGSTASLRAVVGSGSISVGGVQNGSEFWCLDQANLSLTGTASATIVVAGRNDTISATSTTGTNQLFLSNSSNTTLQLTDSANEVVCGSQASTLQIAGGQDSIYAGTGSLQLDFAANTSLPTNITLLNYNPDIDAIDFGTDAVSAAQTTWGLNLSFGHTDLFLYQFFGQVPGVQQPPRGE